MAELDTEALDAKLQRLEDNKHRWARMDLERKIAMGRRLLQRIYEIGPRWVDAALKAKRISPKSPLAGEEWLGGPHTTLRILRLTLDSLEYVARGQRPALPKGAVSTRKDGQVVLKVFPFEKYDPLLFTGFEAEVWMQPEVTVANLDEHIATFYDQDEPDGLLSLVLGAGNVASIPPLDTIYKLFVEGQVVMLKMNPVNEYLGPFFEEAFAEFQHEGFFEIAYGAGDVGEYLCQHEQTEEIHITGSDRTHDIIVYGLGEEGEKRKKEDNPRVDKRITSELGNVSPVIVMPGQWSDKELNFHAENLATQLANNGGFNCNAVRVIITHAEWPQRRAFLDAFRKKLDEIPQRYPYYPGARDRFDRFAEANPDRVETFGERNSDLLPWGLIVGVDAQQDNICFTTESWCGMTSETPISARTPADFLEQAVTMCNETIWGTLNCSIFVHPKTEAQFKDELDEAIARLRYGTIVINHWAALGYGLGVTPWGAHPGHSYQDIGSGIGVVHNTFLLEDTQKTIIRGPFMVNPRPPWFVTNRQTHTIAPRLADFEYQPGVRNLLRIVSRAVRG